MAKAKKKGENNSTKTKQKFHTFSKNFNLDEFISLRLRKELRKEYDFDIAMITPLTIAVGIPTKSGLKGIILVSNLDSNGNRVISYTFDDRVTRPSKKDMERLHRVFKRARYKKPAKGTFKQLEKQHD